MDDFLMWAGGIIFTGLFGLIGWFINRIFKYIDDLEERCDVLSDQISAHKLYAAETYTTKKDVKDMKDEVVQHLIRIERKVDQRRAYKEDASQE